MDQERSKWLVVAVAVLLAAGVACSRKSSSSRSGAQPAVVTPPPGDTREPLPPGTTSQTSVPQDYKGRWRLFRTANAGNGACDEIGRENDLGIVEVDATGAFATDVHRLRGRIDMGGGGVAIVTEDPEPCGQGSGSGSCATDQACFGTWSSNSEAPHAGSWRLERPFGAGEATP